MKGCARWGYAYLWGGGGGLFVPSERYCTLKASDSHFVPTWARKLRNCEKRPGNEIAQACSHGAEEVPGTSWLFEA